MANLTRPFYALVPDSTPVTIQPRFLSWLPSFRLDNHRENILQSDRSNADSQPFQIITFYSSKNGIVPSYAFMV